jgi:hypothetical protein
MPIKLKNNAVGYLASAITASDVGLVLQSGNGASFPTLLSGDYFYVTLTSSGGTTEIVKVTALVGDTMTIVRAQESTTANSFAIGTRVELRVTVASIAGYVQDRVASVKDFGAIGNGVTDDSAAIQTAVNSGFKEIYFPAGTYLMNHPVEVPYNVSLRGAGKGATVIQAGSGIGANFSDANFSSGVPHCRTALFNFIPGQVPLQLPAFASNVSSGQVDLTFASAHGLQSGDVCITVDRTRMLLVSGTSGAYLVGETITGSVSGATGTVRRVNTNGTYARIWYTPVNGTFRPYYGGPAGTETVTGGSSGVTSTSILTGGSWSAHRLEYNTGEMFQVASVTSPTVVRIDGMITTPYYANTTEVWVMRQPTKSTIRDMSIFGSGDSATQLPFGIHAICANGFKADNIEMGRFFYANLVVDRSYMPKVTGCEINQNLEYSLASDFYGIVLGGTYGSMVRNCSISAGRHAVATGGGGYAVNLPNPIDYYFTVENCFLATNGGVQTADYHGNTSHSIYRNNIILGGINLAGRNHTIEGNQISGIGESQSSIAIYMSEIVGIDHTIRNNYITGRGTAETGARGLVLLQTGSAQGVCEFAGQLLIQGNRFVMEGGTGGGALIRMNDTSAVNFTGGMTVIFEDNNVYNTNLEGIKAFSSALAPIERFVLRNNVFRGTTYAMSFNPSDINHGTYNNNYIEIEASTSLAALYCVAAKTLEVVGNSIKKASAGAFLCSLRNTQTLPAIIKDNIVYEYGHVFNALNSLDNAAFGLYRNPGGTSETRMYLTNNRVLSAASTAQSVYRYEDVDLIFRGNTSDFAAPAGPNWVSFFYGTGGGSLKYESATFTDVALSGATTNTTLLNRAAPVSVSTTATMIAADAGASGALCLVNGFSGGDRFCDLVLSSTGVSPTVVQSFTALGSPAARTYTRNGTTLELAMASGTYDIVTLKIGY